MRIKDFNNESKGGTFTQAKVLGSAAVREMLKDAPDIETRFVKSEMVRFGKRVRAKVVRERVKGRPGIKCRTRSSGRVRIETFRSTGCLTQGTGRTRSSGRVRIETLFDGVNLTLGRQSRTRSSGRVRIETI